MRLALAALAVSACALIAAFIKPSIAAPLPGADPSSATAQWFQSLKAPDTGIGCCSEADCRVVESKTDGDDYFVRIGDRWLRVPPEKILHSASNPTGGAVVCYLPVPGIMCFIPGAGL